MTTNSINIYFLEIQRQFVEDALNKANLKYSYFETTTDLLEINIELTLSDYSKLMRFGIDYSKLCQKKLGYILPL